VLALGNTAARSVFGCDQGIGVTHGRIVALGRRGMATYHPAAALRGGPSVVDVMRADLRVLKPSWWLRELATILRDGRGHDCGREAFAAVLAQRHRVVSGTLGAGKTILVHGRREGLGVRERVTSPTFTMVRETRLHALGIETLHHCDVYRVESLDEVLDLAWRIGRGLCGRAGRVGGVAASVFGRDVMTVDFRVDDDDGRTLTVDGELAATRGAQLDRWAS